LPRAKKTSKAKPKSAKRASGGTKKRSVKAAKKTTRKTAKKAVKKTAKKAARKTTRKAVRKTGKKAAKKTARKAVKKVARKVTGRSAKKAAPRKQGSTVARAAVPRVRHSKSRIRELTTMLEAKRAEILEKIKKARRDSMETHGTSFPEVGDLVSASVEKEKAFEHGEAGVNTLREIDTALEKLKAGTYGVCEICNKVIGVKRLRVMPSARLCIKCKSRQEAYGGMDSDPSNTFDD
jgi:RNA polymerase-binding protein DksA